MTKPFSVQIVGHEATANIYVKADGRTVCAETDKDVSEMKYAKGERLTEAQVGRLVFPGAADGVPDASKRSASEIPDAEGRRKSK